MWEFWFFQARANEENLKKQEESVARQEAMRKSKHNLRFLSCLFTTCFQYNKELQGSVTCFVIGGFEYQFKGKGKGVCL